MPPVPVFVSACRSTVSPLKLMAQAYPEDYGVLKACGWQLTALNHWENCYRTGDLIGRSLEFLEASGASSAIPRENSLGPGGHIGYFGDPKVATLLCKML